MAKAKDKSIKKYKIKPASITLLKIGAALYGYPMARKKYMLQDDGQLIQIQPPYILLVNHCSPADVYSIPLMLLPKTGASFLVSETAFTTWGNVLKHIGCIAKKQFSIDTSVVRNIKFVLSKNRPMAIYPEGKFSIDGTPNTIQPSIAKMIKMFKVPVVTVRFDGSYLHHPRWNSRTSKVDVIPTVQVLSADEVASMTVPQLHQSIVDRLSYDDYQYQRDNKISVMHDHLVDGLQYMLHRCPICGKAHAMTASKATLSCSQCGASITMDEYGVLHGCQFDSVPQWNSWQNQLLHQDIDNGAYSIDTPCTIYQQIGNKYKRVGEGRLTHNDSGLDITWQDGSQHFANALFYTLSFENDAVYLPTSNELYKVYVQGVGTTVMLNYATEYYYSKASKTV